MVLAHIAEMALYYGLGDAGWQLASDAVVFKVDSAYGLQMWYHERLKPWVHYIPVKADLSDLHQRFQ